MNQSEEVADDENREVARISSIVYSGDGLQNH